MDIMLTSYCALWPLNLNIRFYAFARGIRACCEHLTSQTAQKSTTKTNKQPIKMKHHLIACGVVACLALGPAAFAQTINGDEPDNSILYLPNVDLTTLSQNNFAGIVGGIFYTPYYYNTTVNWLGYADPTGAPLQMDHTVTIWNHADGSVVVSAVVPAGDPLIYDGYAWVQIASTTLTYQHYYWLGATVTGGVDSWGDVINNTSPDNGNNGQITWNVESGSWGGSANGPMVQAGSGWEFSRAGIYDSNMSDAGNPNPSFTQTSATDSIYPAPNMAYNLPIPEPAGLALAGVGAVMLFGLALKRKSWSFSDVR
jgi:hypothetical protein